MGSGTGKAVVAAAILHNFERCIGIELLDSLYRLSLDLKSEYIIKMKQQDLNNLDANISKSNNQDVQDIMTA